MIRHVDEFDLGLAIERREERRGEIDPRAGGAGADVEEAVGRWCVGEVEGHGDRILHVDEVADLLTIAIVGAVALEEAHLAGLEDLFVSLGDEAPHLPLMPFIRPKDVEVFDADHAVEPAVALRMQVEEVLRVAVGIERAQGVEMIHPVVHAVRPVTIGGGGAGVDKADAALQRPLGEPLGVAEVVLHEVTGIGLGSGGAGAEMEDGADGVEALRLALKPVEEGIGLLVVGEAERGEIFPLRVLAQHIGHEDLLLAALVQGMDQGAADQAGTAGDKDGWRHGAGYFFAVARPLSSSSSLKIEIWSPKTLRATSMYFTASRG